MRDREDPEKPPNDRKPAGQARRDDRLKAALKANMARRKAQARARAEGGAPDSNDKDE
ncbi:MAG: hypothetical protein KBF78_03230 [Fuscovulum sp.]|nr:hypothetical protein [Fuscovulum sp.]